MEDIAIKSNGRMTGAGIWLSHLFDNLGLDRTIASCGSFLPMVQALSILITTFLSKRQLFPSVTVFKLIILISFISLIFLILISGLQTFGQEMKNHMLALIINCGMIGE